MVNRVVRRTAATIAWTTGAALLAAALPAAAQVDVTTQHNDNARTGANLSETVLTPLNVPSQFGKLFERAVDDQVYAQPLLVSGVNIPGVGLRNVLYVATVNDTVYAFDADDPTAAAPLWKKSYINPAAGIVPVSHIDVGQTCVPYNDFTGNIGIVGTPVIDRNQQTMYFVARTKENGTFVQRLHAVDITTGYERAGSPVTIQPTVFGTGDGHDAQNIITFNARTENQRAALLLNRGVVYIAWAAHCDQGPYHGWIVGYDAATLQQTMVYNTSPNGGLGGIWQSGQGPSADSDGNIYAVSGNGSFNGDTGGSERGNSFLKVNAAGALLDWFTPYNWAALNSVDHDLGIQGALLVPNTNLVVSAGKEGVLYVLNRDNMGHFQTISDSQIVQSFQASTSGRMNGSPVYWNGPGGPAIYVWPAGDPLKAYRVVNGRLDTATPTQSPVIAPTGMPGGILSVTANGTAQGIVWAAMSNGGNANHYTQPGILRALDASDVTKELWNSEQNAARDGLGNFAKFVSPTVANGKVYMATFSNKVVVYGLLADAGKPPVVNAGPNQTITWPAKAKLVGSASDDGLPNPPGKLTTRWSVVNGPAAVTFSAPDSLATDATFAAGGTYTLQLAASDGATTTADTVVITVNGGGTGLFAQYFNDSNDGTFFSSGVLTRTDATVDFNWSYGSPDPAVHVDNFSLRWTGQILAPVTGLYTFTTMSDDGIRLWVNGQQIINNWTAHAVTANSGTISLTAGVKYDIKLEFFEKGKLATVQLSWTYPGQQQQVIPQNALFPIAPANQPPRINAGPDQTLIGTRVTTLTGTAVDDGLPAPTHPLKITWIDTGLREPGEGGTVVFSNPNALTTTATFSAPSTYPLRLIVTDGAITVSDDITVVVAQDGTITGLLAQYFNDPGDGTHFVTPAKSRQDPNIEFDWASGAPDPLVQADNFSVRWTGQIKAPVTGAYTFSTTADDGIRVWINGQLVVDDWSDHAARTVSGAAVSLVANTMYDIKVEFYDHTRLGSAKLLWAYPGQSQVIVPASQFYTPMKAGTGLTAQYFNDPGNGTRFNTLALTRKDAVIDFNWSTASPAANIQIDQFSVRWSGQVLAPVTGDYTFSTVSDDGIRVWVNGVHVIDNWTNHGATTNTSAPVALVAGTKYAIKVEYYENAGSAVTRLQWAYPGQTTQVIPQSRLYQ